MEGASRIVETCVDEFGAIDILVNNAGGGSTVHVEEMDEGEWDRVLDMNLKGTYATVHYAVPHMKRKGSGRILNVISRVGLAGSPTMSAYSAAKLGVVGFTYAISKELAASGITVNCVAPTANTVRAQRTATERYAMTGRVIPASANRTPEHIAPIVAHLVGDSTAGITGQVFYAAAGEITLYDAPTPARTIFKQGKWTLDELSSVFPSAFGTTLVPPMSPLPPM
jgi:NAD(P)-dependent dehydrogenase (short-subunit alcohol dehydrogenase family)